MALPFVHLRCSSEYSLTEGTLRMRSALELAEKHSMPALAITDINNISGAIKFFKAAINPPPPRQLAIAPILGAQIWVKSSIWHERQRVLCLVQDDIGYRNLCLLITKSFQQVPTADVAVIDIDSLSQEDFKGLFVLSGHLDGDLAALLLAGYYDKATALAKYWQTLLGTHYLLELQKANRVGEQAVNEGSMALAQELGIAVVATHPILFAEKSDYDAHDVRVCIAHDEIISNPERAHRHSREQYFVSADEMAAKFADIPEALANTLSVAQSCYFLFPFLKQKEPIFHMPTFPTPKGVSTDDFMAKQAQDNLAVRLKNIYPDEKSREIEGKSYVERLAFELAMIRKMGFSGYYLVVAEFIGWARKQGIPVGPGRGSGAGSLAAYVLGITDIDPMINNLLFERFLNPERKSMPDFDIDFCEERRGEVIKHVSEQYTHECVSQIITFMTMGARGAIRDCARALGLSIGAANSLSALIPDSIGMTLKAAFNAEAQIKTKLANEPQLADVWNMAVQLEGLPRNVGVHAAGVLITPKALTQYCPLYQAKEGVSAAAQFDMKDLETLGLVKFDFLGLSTLTIINHAVKHINRLNGNDDFSIDNLPDNDEKTYRIFQSGDTNAIFQCESRTAKDLARRIAIEDFEEITALMALNRPGPLGSGMVNDYIDVKHARKDIFVPDNRLCEILSPTYGVIIYQEQIMQIAQVLSLYSLGAADSLRRAIGKKDANEMAKNKDQFIQGAINNNTDAEVAKNLFELIEKFAEYGFNKSHSAAYGKIAYQTAYLKAHYPAAFMSAVMSSEIGGNNAKIANYLNDCRIMGLTILAPSVNAGQYAFYPKDEKTLVFGLGAIKGLGRAAIEAIESNRLTQGVFHDFANFLSRIDARSVNKKALESLIKAGACDEFDGKRLPYRSHYLASVKHHNDQDSGLIGGLFDDDSKVDNSLALSDSARIFSKRQNLKWEHEVLEFYFSGHMMDFYRSDFQALKIPLVSSFAEMPAGEEKATWVAGMLTSKPRIRKTAKGLMLSAFLDDGSGLLLDIAVFSKLLESVADKVRDKLLVGRVVLIYGNLSIDESAGGDKEKFSGMPRMRVAKVMDYAEALKLATSMFMPITSMDELNHLRQCIQKAESGNIELWATVQEETTGISAESIPSLSIKATVKLAQKHNILITEKTLLQWREYYETLDNPACFPQLTFASLPTQPIKKTWQAKKNKVPSN